MPVCLLVDTSSNMEGAAIEALRQGLEHFQHELSSDQFARDVAVVAVISVDCEALIETNGLIPIHRFTPPCLVARGARRLDLAFERLIESFDRDVQRPVKGGHKGDWEPAVFVLLSGQPTDASGYVTDALWRPARDAVTSRPKGPTKPSTIVAAGMGPNCDDATLKETSIGTAFRVYSSAAAVVSLFGYVS